MRKIGINFSLKRELNIVKESLKAAPVKEQTKTKPVQDPSRFVRWIVRAVVLVIAIVFIVLGVINGGMEDVLQKAIRICTECIGLG